MVTVKVTPLSSKVRSAFVGLVDQTYGPRAVVRADWRGRAALPMIERITQCGEVGRGNVGARKGLVTISARELQHAVLHCEDGVTTGNLPFSISTVTWEAITDLDGTENAAGGTEED